MRLSFLIVIGILLLSCNSKQTKSEKQINLDLESFSTLPESIDGCGELYSLDSIQFSKKEYVFASNLAEFAVIKLNGKDIHLQVESEGKNEETDGFVSIFKSKNYTVIVRTRKIIEYDEGGIYEGTIELQQGDKKKIYAIYGESGC